MDRKVSDIEKYLANEMTADERTSFEAAMEHDPALAKEVGFMCQLTEDIETAALADHVNEALRDLPLGNQESPKYHWWPVLILAGLLVVALLFFQPKNRTAPQPVTHPPAEMPPVDSLRPVPPLAGSDQPSLSEPAEKNTTGQPNRPIAQQQLDEHDFTPMPAPRLRGSGSSSDTSRQALLDALWYTAYPPNGASFTGQFAKVDALLQQGDFSKSYARLQLLERKIPANDTLFFLKGYCLLERGEGKEALRYFDKIENDTSFGKELLEWYRGLAFLLLGNDAQAKKVFVVISKSPAHPFQQQALRALALMG